MEQALGPEAKLKAEMLEGKIKLSIAYDGKQLDGGAWVAADSDQLVDALAELIPGASPFEQAAVAVLKMALKAVKV